MKRNCLLALLLLITAAMAAQTARHFKVNLSDDGAANLDVYIAQNPTGRAIVCCPGGGYSHLAIQHEGTDWAPYFNRQGITLCVLTYRMPKGDRTIPVGDAEHALRTVRDSADVWGVNPADVGIMGFSAGGHLASTVATHADILTRPDFQILFYPVISMVENESHKGSVVGFLGDNRTDEKLVRQFSNYNAVRRHQTPPAFLCMAEDDQAVPPATNGIPYYLALRKNGIPASLHIWPDGGHGFGIRTTFAHHDMMLAELTAWLKALPAPKKGALRVACIGNSITDGAGISMFDVDSYPAKLQRQLGSDYCVLNFGRSGRTLLSTGDHPYTREQAWRDARTFLPDIAIIKLGTNDSKPKNWEGHARQFETELRAMVDTLRALPTKPRIFLCTPLQCSMEAGSQPDNQIRNTVIESEIIPIIRKVAKKYKLEIIDLHPLIDPNSDAMQRDHIHPTPKGTGIMAKAIAEAIRASKS